MIIYVCSNFTVDSAKSDPIRTPHFESFSVHLHNVGFCGPLELILPKSAA